MNFILYAQEVNLMKLPILKLLHKMIDRCDDLIKRNTGFYCTIFCVYIYKDKSAVSYFMSIEKAGVLEFLHFVT